MPKTFAVSKSAGGSGTVTSVSVATANGFSGTVANATTTPAITIIAGAITPTSIGSATVATTQTPADNSTKLATTAYVDNAILGQRYKEAVKVATTANLVGAYLNGTLGVGATFIYTATGVDAVDGVNLALNDRVLLKNQTSDFQNGIYTVTTAGAIGVAGILTRATDFDQASDIQTGDSVFVTAGTTLTSTTWAYTGIDSPTMGTTSLTFAQAAGQGSFTGGTGITITGTSIAIDTSVTVDKTTAQTGISNKTFVAPVLGAATGTSIVLTGGGLTLAAGTTTIFPIKFISGTSLTTPVAGVVEFDGTDYFITV